ncbi:MAG TPA: tetratricopeptide repeat protein, partial [candidate division Zixibacteria bacterium]|nr:tetratricopeptide repeat protein [candidate division Zixibacteria bacterium]
KDYWVSLGDTYLQLQRLKDAIAPYEKAVALDDSDLNVWRNLADLYHNHSMPDKAAAADKKVAELSK